MAAKPTIIAPSDANFSEEYRGQGGIIKRGSAELRLVQFCITRHKYHSASSWQIEATPLPSGDAERDRDHAAFVIGPHAEPLEFHGTDHYGHTIIAPRLRPLGGSLDTVRCDLSGFYVNTESLASRPTSQSFEIWMSHNLRAAPRNSFLSYSWAEPKHDFGSHEQQPFTVQVGGLSYELVAANRIEQTIVHDIEAQVHIPQCVLFHRCSDESITQEPRLLLDRLADELRDFCSVMTLLCRSPVSWTAITVSSIHEVPQQPDFWTVDSTRFARPAEFGRTDVEDLMVLPARMSRTALSEMAGVLRALPIAPAIRAAIGYLIEARRGRFLQYAVLNAWTALETLVNGMSAADGTDRILDEEIFDRLCKDVRDTIKRFSNEHGLEAPRRGGEHEKAKRAQIYEKLGELNRPPLVPRVVDALKNYQLDVEHLWQREWPAKRHPLRKRLSDAYSRRSDLIHRGAIADARTLRGDYLRIHALTELLIYRILGGADDALSDLGWGQLYRHHL